MYPVFFLSLLEMNMRIMRKTTLLAMVLLWTGGVYAQVLNEWRSPETAELGKEYPTTGFMSYTSRDDAARNDYSTSPYYNSLDGAWKHKRFSSVGELTEDVFTVEYNASAWEEVNIPQKKSVVPNSEKILSIPNDVSVDVFRTEFHMPFSWADKEIFIEIGGASSGVSVFVNGTQAGYAEDSNAPAMYDVTTLVKEGNNTLVVAATAWSTGSQLEANGRSGGLIVGNVTIKTLPKIRVRDFEVTTGLTDNYRNGVLDFGVVVKSHLLNQKDVKVYFELFAPGGELLKSETKEVSLRMRGEQTVHFDVLIPEVYTWSPDNPEQYTAMIRIQHEGRYTEYIERKVGFRSIEVSGARILLNGKPASLQGVNVGDFPTDPYEMESAFREMKSQHINAIRLVQSPKPELFYEMCDRYGFYVLSEAHIDSRTYGFAPETTLGNNPAYLNAHMNRVRSMYERTKNYASVIAFSLADQGGNGYNFYEAYLWMKSCEKARPVLYGGAGREWNTDVIIGGSADESTFVSERNAANPRPVLVISEEQAFNSQNITSGFIGIWSTDIR